MTKWPGGREAVCAERLAGRPASPLAAGDRPSSALALWRQGVYIAHLWCHLRKRLRRVAADGVPRAAGLWLEVGSGCCWNSVSFLANDGTLHISKSSGQGIASPPPSYSSHLLVIQDQMLLNVILRL